MDINGVLKNMKPAKPGILIGFAFFWGFFAQAQEVSSSIDSSAIKIGEKITYKISVDADPASAIKFPQGQTFLPLEVFDSTAVDTFTKKNTVKLEREYDLTQFDSGAYTIPKQKILINDKAYYTDSVPVQVNSVAVDTTKQNLYPIKPAIDVGLPFKVPTWVWWVLGAVVLIGLFYLIKRMRRKIIEKKKELPPYEKAIQTLKTLDEGKELESGDVKGYYTSLSEAIKRYIDEEIDDRALESTTDELITLLNAYKVEKEVELGGQVIESLDTILKRADLAKFAGIQTDKLTAREDRKAAEANINAFDQSIPEPTEEELMQDEAYRREKERKLRRRRRLIRVGIGVLALVIAGSVFVSLKGMDYTKELFTSHSTKKMLKRDWFKSEYGVKGVQLSTPEILVRKMDTVKTPYSGKTAVNERFSFGGHDQNLFVEVTNIRFKKSAEIDSVDVGELLDKKFDTDSIKYATFKHEDFTSASGDEGQKVFGTFKLETPKSERKKDYTFLVFNKNGGLQEIMISYDDKDEKGEEIQNRIVNSVEFSSIKND